MGSPDGLAIIDQPLIAVYLFLKGSKLRLSPLIFAPSADIQFDLLGQYFWPTGARALPPARFTCLGEFVVHIGPTSAHGRKRRGGLRASRCSRITLAAPKQSLHSIFSSRIQTHNLKAAGTRAHNFLSYAFGQIADRVATKMRITLRCGGLRMSQSL